MAKHHLAPLDDKSIIYARPGGWHYHLSKECSMLTGGDFEELDYRQISFEDIFYRELKPCLCAYKGYKIHKLKGIHKGGAE